MFTVEKEVVNYEELCTLMKEQKTIPLFVDSLRSWTASNPLQKAHRKWKWKYAYSDAAHKNNLQELQMSPLTLTLLVQ